MSEIKFKGGTDIQMLDPFELLAAMERKSRKGGRRNKDEVVSYYRRPKRRVDGRPIGQAGWIIWGDTQSGKRDDYLYRGFEPLNKYGRVWDEPTDPDGQLYRRYGPWGAILSRPGGPEEFPVEQIVTYRWYRPDQIGSPDQGFDAMAHVRFPQLHKAVEEGLKIQEYLCPECEAMSYLQAVHLARHLRNSHDWDRADILAWGAAMQIDFSKEFRPRVVKLVDLDDLAPAPEAAVVEAPPVSVEVVRPPTREDVKAQKPCLFCARAKVGVCKKHKAAS